MRRAGRRALLVLASVAASPLALADSIRLKSGGEIRAEQWWTEGATLFYESPAGSVGIPLSLVLRIEPSGESAAAGSALPTRAERVAPAPPPKAALSAGEPSELHEWMARGTDAFRRRDFEVASAAFESAWSAKRELSAARVGYALSEISLGRDARALSCVLEGISIDPGDADLHEILGDLQDRDERVDDAVRAWKEAFRLAASDRLRDKIMRAERELLAGRDYAFSAAPHFNLRYDGALNADLTEAITEFLETTYARLADQFRHAPSQAITVLLYPERQFREVTLAPDEVAGLFDGKIRVPLGGLKRLDAGAERLLVHELTHAFVHSKTRGNCPRWLHEGLAQQAEGKTLLPAERAGLVRLLRRKDPPDWDPEEFSYAAALSLTASLEALRGPAGLLDLLDRLEAGNNLESAVRGAYNVEFDELRRSWARQVGAQSRRP